MEEDLSVSIREKICQIVLGAQQVAASSEQLSASADQTAKATEVITESVNEIATGSEKQVITITQTFESSTNLTEGIDRIQSSIGNISQLQRKLLILQIKEMRCFPRLLSKYRKLQRK